MTNNQNSKLILQKTLTETHSFRLFLHTIQPRTQRVNLIIYIMQDYSQVGCTLHSKELYKYHKKRLQNNASYQWSAIISKKHSVTKTI